MPPMDDTQATRPPMRSKLFVPGSRPELFAKALASAADALSFDLEDAVAEPRKAEAREALHALLRQPQLQACGKTLIVRSNGTETPHFVADVAAVTCDALQLLNLPKVEAAQQVHAAVAVLEAAERAHDVRRPVRLLLTIESARGLQKASVLAATHPRVAGLQLGLGDLFEPLGIARGDGATVHAAMFALRMAAAAAGVWACDAAFADVQDQSGFLAEAEMARRLGFVGKSCIHPSQVALAHQVFRPQPSDIERAQRVVQAAREARLRGLGAFVVDGRMVDEPFMRSAEALLADARRLGLLELP